MPKIAQSVAFYTLGCKLNFSETSTIARQLKKAGFQKKEFHESADVYIINTCSVTQNADRECKKIVQKARKTNPDATIIIIGCYAQLKPYEIEQIPGVDLVLGAKEKFNIISFLQKDLNTAKVHSCDIDQVNQFVGSYSMGDRTRAFLKVQDGCDYKCTYCTIPLARGISRSDTIDNILNNAQEIVSQGIKEIVLTGVNIGDYGKGEFGNKKHEHTFLDLLKALEAVKGIERIRISSIEPNLLKDEIIEYVLNSDTLMPHFHIPLQSGSDYLLGKMKRRYNTDLYQKRIHKIKSLQPDACIGADVIVGFPAETEARFLETYNFLKDLDISYLHVFTYSERADTEALEMSDVVPMAERKKRNKLLRILSEKKTQAFYRSQLGKQRTVLWENENKDGYILGYTDNYVRVKTPFHQALFNQLSEVQLSFIDEEGLVQSTQNASITL